MKKWWKQCIGLALMVCLMLAAVSGCAEEVSGNIEDAAEATQIPMPTQVPITTNGWDEAEEVQQSEIQMAMTTPIPTPLPEAAEVLTVASGTEETEAEVQAVEAEKAPAPKYAVVNNPYDYEVLNLRAEPTRRSKSIGNYYNGTFVRVLETVGDWAKVSIGTEGGQAVGYMMLSYLNMDPVNVGEVTPLKTMAVTKLNGIDLLSAPQGDSLGVVRYGSLMSVMGACDIFYHVQYGGITGYINKNDLGPAEQGLPLPDGATRYKDWLNTFGQYTVATQVYTNVDETVITISMNDPEALGDKLICWNVWVCPNPPAYGERWTDIRHWGALTLEPEKYESASGPVVRYSATLEGQPMRGVLLVPVVEGADTFLDIIELRE